MPLATPVIAATYAEIALKGRNRRIFLRRLLKRDPNVDLISFFILRTPTDLTMVDSSELSLIPFPTDELFRKELGSFDLVLLQNFNHGPYGIGGYLPDLRRYVERGGGLAMIGGDLSFTSGGYAGTQLAEVLPVKLLPLDADPSRLVSEESFRPRVPELDAELSAAAVRAGELHYAIRYHDFLGVRSDWFLAEEATRPIRE